MIIDTKPNSRSLAALTSITQNVLLARSLRSRNSNTWYRHHCSMSQHLCTTSSV